MSRQKKIGILFLCDLLLLSLGLVIRPIASAMITYLPDCVWGENAILCPSCGATRCVQALVSFQFSWAFSLNPFFFLLTFFLLFLWLMVHLEVLFQLPLAEKTRKLFANGKTVIILVFLWVAFGVIRNLL